MDFSLLRDVLIIFAFSMVALLVCHRIGVPSIIGFLFTGIIAGPYVLGLIKAPHEVEILAEIGIILLLFTIGLEFSFKSLAKIKRQALLGGSLQIVLTFAAALAIALAFKLPLNQSVLIGFLVALSSTAIVLKIMQEKAEIDTPHGRTTFGILILQDIAIVPLIIIIPLLAGSAADVGQSVVFTLAKAVIITISVIAGAKWVVPFLLYQVARTKNRELFLLSVVSIGLGVAWLTSSIGLSLALGAFLAGLMISESEYSHQALGNVLPFRDLFTSLFFISIGMLLDLQFFLKNPGLILLIAVLVFLVKSFFAGGAAVILGYPIRTAVLVALALSQVGEFSFILSGAGLKNGLLSTNTYQLFLAVSVLTMASTPLFMKLAPKIAQVVSALPMPGRLKSGYLHQSEESKPVMRDHLVIIGFGFNGRNLAHAAYASDIPYAVVEMNTELVRAGREKGELIWHGDATQEPVLENVYIKDARVVVIAISDPLASRRITEVTRRLNPAAYVIVRTRYINELELLHKLGANEVIAEEFETSVEIFTRVLAKYLVPQAEIHKIVDKVRADGYMMFRLSAKPEGMAGNKPDFQSFDLKAFKIDSGSKACGKSLGEIALRKSHGVTVLTIRKGSKLLTNPGGDSVLNAGDVIVAVGSPGQLATVDELFVNSE